MTTDNKVSTPKIKTEEEISEHEGTFEIEENDMENRYKPVFDGKDDSMWKKRITMFLKMKKFETVITSRKNGSR